MSTMTHVRQAIARVKPDLHLCENISHYLAVVILSNEE